MNLIRIIAIAVAVWLVIHFTRQYLTRRRALQARKRPAAVASMVRCEHCGVHLPQAEAVEAGGRYYCSAQHRDLAKQS